MRIMLKKVTKTPFDFDVSLNEISFKGFLQYHSDGLVLLKARLYGILEQPCDICTTQFKLNIDENIELFISDGIFEDEDHSNLDVIESLNGYVDIQEILHSEIELIKSDYHYCSSCKNSLEEF